jgi:PIN domain nuclease of toxin-antitoxin system
MKKKSNTQQNFVIVKDFKNQIFLSTSSFFVMLSETKKNELNLLCCFEGLLKEKIEEFLSL